MHTTPSTTSSQPPWGSCPQTVNSTASPARHDSVSAMPMVGPFLEVEEVVDKVGGNLHAAGKEGAQQGGCGLELSVAEGKGTAQQYRDDGSRQRLGAGGEKPCVG